MYKKCFCEIKIVLNYISELKTSDIIFQKLVKKTLILMFFGHSATKNDVAGQVTPAEMTPIFFSDLGYR